jgi:hypothetical protein
MVKLGAPYFKTKIFGKIKKYLTKFDKMYIITKE